MRRVPFQTMSMLVALAACSSAGKSGTGGSGGEGGSGEGGAVAGSGGQGGGGGTTVKLDAAPLTPDAGGIPVADAGPDLAITPDVGAEDAAASPDAPIGGGPMVLISSAFKEGGSIAPMYRCKTENISPPLSWTPGPAGTQSYAMMLFHSTAIHWVLWDIPATVTSLPAKIERLPMPPVPPGSKQAKPNLDGSTWYGYTGPCPATSSHYEYIVYALKVATLPGVTPESMTKAVNTAIMANKLASAQLSGTAAN
jgi:Raf kinase inhibitor-like YbhB/YbcL family protein